MVQSNEMTSQEEIASGKQMNYPSKVPLVINWNYKPETSSEDTSKYLKSMLITGYGIKTRNRMYILENQAI